MRFTPKVVIACQVIIIAISWLVYDVYAAVTLTIVCTNVIVANLQIAHLERALSGEGQP